MLEQLIKDFEIARNNCETVLYNGKPCPYSDVCIGSDAGFLICFNIDIRYLR